MNHDGDARYTALGDLSGHGFDSIANPRADFRVAVLMHWEVVGASREKGRLRVDATVVEDIVNGDNEKVVEGL